jgi:ribulose-5-phosphate 4-epimerase/fuculose-1-phosphate aldolase
MSEEQTMREAIVRWGRSLFERGYTVGSSGNISIRLTDGFLMTPTNSCLGFLETESLARFDNERKQIGGDKATKEMPLHFAFYDARASARAVVHLHSTYATALSCIDDTDPQDTIPPITPYVVMRVGKVPLVDYSRPGSDEIVPLIRSKAADSPAVLLANHGPVVSAVSLESAVFAMEELEETAKLAFLTRGMKVRHLTPEQIADLTTMFQLR